ncbi:hypothetical protein CC77DRAFT_390909 [Alternaria alternata]|uniref:C2H2-type domain-containing protein n=1 Tax=Alternaria alternata TaxID=5599 RepID=A0A177DAI3_ALTAL|nr:hypothetical protein CC77DRAFT_390909 [Alternaria alternata]OAG16190.1 hypothetical protein CC77DRAFT_390909 [Alternaria alternata]
MSTSTLTPNFDTSRILRPGSQSQLPISSGSGFATNTDRESYCLHETLEEVNDGDVLKHNANGTNIHGNRSFRGNGDIARVEHVSGDLTYWDCHSGDVSLGDTAPDRLLDVRNPDTQQPWSPPQYECGEVVQEYENTNSPWSFHGFLGTEESAGDFLHQDASDVELWMQDQLFLNLDLIDEQQNHLQTPLSRCETLRVVSERTEQPKRLRIIRGWLSLHASNPYPTSAEISELVEATGCTERQLKTCLTNLRTREKHLLGGRPNECHGGSITRPQPRDLTTVHLTHVQSSSMVNSHDMPHAIDTNENSHWLSLPAAGYPTPDSVPGVIIQICQDFKTDLVCQRRPEKPVPRSSIMPKRKGRRYRAQTCQAGVGENMSDTQPIHIAPSGLSKPKNRFSCTVVGCYGSFKNASDWKRHEAGVHGYSDREWVCMLTEAFRTRSECVFCLEPMDSVDHLTKHLIAPCSDKCIIERTFFRKDLLKQHVLHVHLAGEPVSVKKNFTVPQGWSREVESSAIEPNSCWCGFCGQSFESVTTRMDHVAQHFRQGLDMRAWNRI